MKFYENNPYVKYLGMKLENIACGSINIAMKIDAKTHSNVYHAAHGGALMSLADTAMGAACLSVNKKVVTLEMNINCIKSVPEEQVIYAHGKVLHNGMHTVIAECEITGKNGDLYAKARGSFYVLNKFTE